MTYRGGTMSCSGGREPEDFVGLPEGRSRSHNHWSGDGRDLISMEDGEMGAGL